MSSIVPAKSTIELLDTLKETVEDLARRSEKLGDDFRTRTVKEQRRCEVALEEQSTKLTAATAEAEANFQTGRTASQARFDQRKIRIGRAYQASKDQGLKRVDDKIGARKYELQKAMLQAEKDREQGTVATHAHFDEFARSLAVEQEQLARLEGSAQRAFKGYGKFRRLFEKAYAGSEPEAAGEEDPLLIRLRQLIARGGKELEAFRDLKLVRLLRWLVLWIALALCELALVPILSNYGITSFGWREAGVATGGTLVVLLALRFWAQAKGRPPAETLSRTLAKARRIHDLCDHTSRQHYQQELERLKNDFAQRTQQADQRLKQSLAEAGDLRVACRMRSDQRTVRANTRNERLYRARLERQEREHHENLQRLAQAGEVRAQALRSGSEQVLKRLSAEYEAARQALAEEWRRRTAPLFEQLAASHQAAEVLFPTWSRTFVEGWKPPVEFAQAAQFGRLEVDLAAFCEKLPKEKGLELPGPAQFPAPLGLGYPDQGSILIETDGAGHDQAVGVLNNIVIRLLAGAPPGRVHFTILDPVGLGQNFAGVMHMADYEEQIINSRIWTQATQIEQKLADLNEHMEKVIQMYLRNEYQTIAEYNKQAGVIAEKYYFLVIADFPANFTDVAAKRLLSIAASGARCGVYTLIHWDHRQPLPQDFIPDELRKSSFCMSAKGEQFVLTGKAMRGLQLLPEQPPEGELAIEFVHKVGLLSKDSSRVEVPFEQVSPTDVDLWSLDTTNELQVAIGRTGATKLQYLAIGKGTCQHGLIGGKTGSGKSTLFHVIVTNLALWCSPEQVEFYLVDFKKGVEFKCYAAQQLPHARVVAIESDREFGLSVLQRVDEELKRRGDLFRTLGVQDLPGYKRAGGKECLPRTLLMVDEFQEFFVEDDKIAQTASLLLDRIVRQGRAFGIHVLLGSQTLGGAYTVARSTLGQMVIRIALQCNEADAYLIMDDSNPAPRLLSRPGEGIYNDMAGALEGNSPFQVVWLPEQVRDTCLAKVRARANQQGDAWPGPIVFEGNAPADVAENPLLRRALEAPPIKAPPAARIWLGAPNSIKGPTEALFRRQSGSNLLIIGQRDEAILAMISIGLVCLSAQYPADTARIILCDASPPGTRERDYLERISQGLPGRVRTVRQGDLPQVMKELDEEMKRRAEAADAETAPPVFLLIHGLQRFNKLRYEEDFGFASGEAASELKPAAALNNLVCEGTRLGLHVIASCDTYNNVVRFLSRKALSEFEMRVLFQMSANDSASLIDNPKAGMLGLHRALFYNAQEGQLETFRPYALPANHWIDQAAQKISRLKPVTQGA